MAFHLSLEGPAVKRLKQNDGSASTDDIFKQYVRKILESKTNLKVILSDEYVKPVPMLKAYAGLIKDVKKIFITTRVLNEKLPLNELAHCKRVRGRYILLCQVSNGSRRTNVEEYIHSLVPEVKDVFEHFIEIDVPAYMPKMKWQYAEISKTWSCNFHPDMYIERLTNFPDINLHRTYMAMNFATVGWYCRKQKLEINENVLNSVNASVVVDPSIESVVAVSFDNRLEHPVQHSVMIAIDNVAKTQAGGAWPSEKSGNVALSGIDESLLEYLKESFPSIKFGAKEYFSKVNIDVEMEKDYTAPYLCTNYNIYLLREPCIMCSMALTHARMKKVFFCVENTESGGVCSRAKLHTVTYLNHHFEVFTGFLAEDSG